MVVAIGTRCVLFTDLVRSTELRISLGEDRADDLQRRHDALLATTIEGAHGMVVKYLGDGLLGTFESAADGVAGAIAVQQAVAGYGARHPEWTFEVRVGLSIGDVSVERDDVFGTAVVEAARLCAAANGGEILAADVVRALARGRGGFAFESMGALELKGLPEPVAACSVGWDVPEVPHGGVPLPPLLVGPSSVGYVGRQDVLSRIDGAWDSVRNGSCASVLLSGEPGIGKTRTSSEVARRVGRTGGLVLYGRCEEGLGLPYQPFLEALDHYVRHAAEPALGRLPGELARLLPDLAQRVPDLPAPVASDARTEEHRLLSATASWLVEASRASGLLLVLDDLHWATRPTLLMLAHVVREAEATDDARLLVIGTFRDSDLDPEHPITQTLADLARLDAVQRIGLQGLTDEEVYVFLEAAAGHELDEDGEALARMLHAETEGNPFFVGEVVRHLVETGEIRREGDRWVVPDVRTLSVPEGVRDVIMRRLARLGDDARQVLTMAAVVGRDIDVDVLCAVADHSEDVVIDALDDALRARIVEETGADHYRFSHALVRTTLYDQLSATRRRRVHRRTAAALEKLHPDDVSALAHHFVEGGPEHGDTSQAVRYTIAAAAQSLQARALSEAEARYRTALELLDDDDQAAPGARLDALIGLGLSLRDQGKPGFREVLLDASRRAHLLGDLPRQVQAALQNNRGTGSIVGATDHERIAELEAAIAAVGNRAAPERALLLARMAAEYAASGTAHRDREYASEALDICALLGDTDLRGQVLGICGMSFTGARRGAQRPRLLRDAIADADRSGDPTTRVWSRLYATGDALARFDLATDRRLREEARAIAEREGGPTLRWATRFFSVVPLMVRGRLEEAGALADDALTLGLSLGEPDAESWWGACLAPIALLRDGVGTVADLAGGLRAQFPEAEGWRTFHLLALAEAGRHDEARALLSGARFDPGVLGEAIWFTAPACHLAETAALLEDQDLARLALDVLARHRAEFSHVWISAIGAVDHFAGRALATLGGYDEAVACSERALATCEEAGALLHVPQSRLGLAQALLRRGRPGDAGRAARERDLGLVEAAGIGLPWLTGQLEGLTAQ